MTARKQLIHSISGQLAIIVVLAAYFIFGCEKIAASDAGLGWAIGLSILFSLFSLGGICAISEDSYELEDLVSYKTRVVKNGHGKFRIQRFSLVGWTDMTVITRGDKQVHGHTRDEFHSMEQLEDRFAASSEMRQRSMNSKEKTVVPRECEIKKELKEFDIDSYLDTLEPEERERTLSRLIKDGVEEIETE